MSRGLNRGTVPRQVGSTMKPIGAYALALEKNKINWSTPLLDAPVRQLEDEKTGELKDWPANFSKTYAEDDILVVDALAQSINTIAVRVGEQAGVGNIYRFMKNSLGVTSLTPEDNDSGPMILGSQTHGISPYELAGAYMMLGNGGSFHHVALLYQRADGLRPRDRRAGAENKAGSGNGHRICDEPPAGAGDAGQRNGCGLPCARRNGQCG